jgi:phosphoglucomutase
MNSLTTEGTGMNIQQEMKRWQELATDATVADELDDLVRNGTDSQKADAFFQELEFGTAGLRGVIGPGTNRMNVYTVGKATQGLADYLNANFDDPSVAIARDSRLYGELFVKRAASVLAANGIRVHMYPRVEPTPALSFAVRDLGCSAGINMTASHNPAAYNGYKVYGDDGCQIATEAAAQISKAVANVDAFADVLSTPFDDAVSYGMVDYIGEDTLDRFIDAIAAAGVESPEAEGTDLKLVYTPLNGAGLECVSRILDRIGVTDVAVVPEQAQPDGNFPTCPKPNPEIREALDRGIALCREVHPDLLIATDPDADRVGIACENEGGYALLTGNEVGVLLLDYICRTRRATASMPTSPLAVSTIVSTVMIDAVADDHKVAVERTLTGFKYIGGVIARLEGEGRASSFVFGFEESYGYLAGTHVRDKDAVVATMLICQMARYYKARGMNLVQAMHALYERYGYYRNRTLDMEFPGADGARLMTKLMAGLRRQPPSEIAGMPVESVVDYQGGRDGLPSANVLEFRLPNTSKVMFRPSGTEPKVKAYLFAKGTTAAQADALLDELQQAAESLVSS